MKTLFPFQADHLSGLRRTQTIQIGSILNSGPADKKRSRKKRPCGEGGAGAVAVAGQGRNFLNIIWAWILRGLGLDLGTGMSGRSMKRRGRG